VSDKSLIFFFAQKKKVDNIFFVEENGLVDVHKIRERGCNLVKLLPYQTIYIFHNFMKKTSPTFNVK